MQNKTVDRFDQEKLYIQLTKIVLDEIRSGRLKPGQQIPTEEELCRKYEVSKITVRQAINNLASDGFLVKVQGKGTFVAEELPATGLSMRTRLTEEMFGKEVEGKKEVIFRGVKDAPEAQGYLRTTEKIYYILNKRTVNEEPVCIEESFIPYTLVPGIEGVDITSRSLYGALQEQGVKKLLKVIQTIEIQYAQGDYARNLGVEEGSPVLAVHRLLLSSDDRPVAYTRLLGRSDRYKLQSEFERIR
ncbi:MAG: GntR family transcriptional regulator [Nitrospirales bacterium]|nr:GntR family transcriptional regulator [Nitrospirales bacterium]